MVTDNIRLYSLTNYSRIMDFDNTRIYSIALTGSKCVRGPLWSKKRNHVLT